MPGDSDRIAEAAYDELAESYVEDIESNPYNRHLEFPGTTSLIPAVDGKRILDAGCGPGLYTEWLREQGAAVVAMDVSEEMLEAAQDRVGDGVEFHQAALGERLEFAGSESFDGIVSALVLGYVADWGQVFEEFYRILEPGGFVVFSTTHPFDEFPLEPDENYFEIDEQVKEWAVDVPYYRRPLTAIFNPVIESGFRFETVAEPEPTAAFEAEWPERYEKESRHPVFLCCRVRKPD